VTEQERELLELWRQLSQADKDRILLTAVELLPGDTELPRFAMEAIAEARARVEAR
jgi:hypothetical protein